MVFANSQLNFHCFVFKLFVIVSVPGSLCRVTYSLPFSVSLRPHLPFQESANPMTIHFLLPFMYSTLNYESLYILPYHAEVMGCCRNIAIRWQIYDFISNYPRIFEKKNCFSLYFFKKAFHTRFFIQKANPHLLLPHPT